MSHESPFHNGHGGGGGHGRGSGRHRRGRGGSPQNQNNHGIGNNLGNQFKHTNHHNGGQVLHPFSSDIPPQWRHIRFANSSNTMNNQNTSSNYNNPSTQPGRGGRDGRGSRSGGGLGAHGGRGGNASGNNNNYTSMSQGAFSNVNHFQNGSSNAFQSGRVQDCSVSHEEQQSGARGARGGRRGRGGRDPSAANQHSPESGLANNTFHRHPGIHTDENIYLLSRVNNNINPLPITMTPRDRELLAFLQGSLQYRTAFKEMWGIDLEFLMNTLGVEYMDWQVTMPTEVGQVLPPYRPSTQE